MTEASKPAIQVLDPQPEPTTRISRIMRAVSTIIGLGAQVVEDAKALKQDPKAIVSEAKRRAKKASESVDQ